MSAQGALSRVVSKGNHKNTSKSSREMIWGQKELGPLEANKQVGQTKRGYGGSGSRYGGDSLGAISQIKLKVHQTEKSSRILVPPVSLVGFPRRRPTMWKKRSIPSSKTHVAASPASDQLADDDHIDPGACKWLGTR